MLLISSTTAAEGMPTLSDHHNPAVEAPSLTGVPSPGTPGGIPLVEPNAPIVGLGFDVLEGAEPPLAYTRFDESRSRLPVVSEVLGLYPHISVLEPLAR